MLARALLPAYGRLLGLLLGARVELSVTPSRSAPLSPLTLQLASLSMTATALGEDSRAALPVRSASLAAVGEGVQLGWKPLALLAAPFWLLVPSALRASTLSLLLLLLLGAPDGPSGGVLEFEVFASEEDLNAGAWRPLLGTVLSGISRNSLPGVLATLNADGTPSNAQLPPSLRSRCTAARVCGNKLELDGQVKLKAPIGAAPGGGAASLRAGAPLDYTLRTGLAAQRVNLDEVVAVGARRDSLRMRGERSAFVWASPELKLDLGDGPLARLLPQLWLPVAATSGAVLPRCIELRRVAISDAAAGVVAAGEIDLPLGRRRREEEQGRGGAMTAL
jgi:hypothetical protein